MPKRPVPLWYVFAAGFLAVGVGIALLFTYAALSSRDRLADTCAVIETSRAEKRAQLKAYEETPPVSETGRNIRDTYAESLAAWDKLWNSLGCKEVPPRS
jgi:hypothetical protein